MNAQNIRLMAIRIIEGLDENRRKAERYNHEYLEFWRGHYSL